MAKKKSEELFPKTETEVQAPVQAPVEELDAAKALVQGAAKTEDIIPPLKEDIDDPATRIRNYQDGIKKELEGLKTKLARQLSDAVKTKKLLEELGIKDVLLDPQFMESASVLGIGPSLKPLAPPAPKEDKKTRGPKSKFTLDDITKFIGDEEKSITEIREHLGTSNVTIVKKLKELEDSKIVSSRKEGVSKMFRLVKKG